MKIHKGKFGKIAVWFIPVVIGGAVIWYMNRKPKLKIGNDTDNPAASSGGGSAGFANPFPIKKGSKNQLVRQLQSALISKYGASVLPRYGADGDWGSETEAAVSSKLGIHSVDSQGQLDNILRSLQYDLPIGAMW